MTLLTWKTLYEIFKKEVPDYRVSTQKTQAASGVAEDVNERTQLLENMILELEEVEKQHRLERKEKTQKDKDLPSASE